MEAEWEKQGKWWKLPPLFKREATSKIRVWQIRVRDEQDGTATIEVEYGQLNGKSQTTQDHIASGKNTGRKNATTAFQQALAEAYSQWTVKQNRKGYALSPDETRTDYRPMLAQPLNKVKVDYWDSAFVQPKFDGYRCLAKWDSSKKTVELISREGQPITQVPHVNEAVKQVCLAAKRQSCTLDGELYTHDLAFGKISSALKRVKDPDPELVSKVQYFCYDIVDPSRDFFDRFVTGTDWLKRTSNVIERVDTESVESLEQLMKYQAAMISDGYEGAMLRNGIGVYEHKRSNTLVKVKTFHDGEFKVVGVTNGRGSYADCAVFKCVTREGFPFDVTAPGSIPEKQKYLENPTKWIGRLLTVKYMEFTDTAKPVPRMPVALRFRK